MNDPTNWNADDLTECLGTFKDNAMAKEVAKRCNAYPGLVELLSGMCRNARAHDMALTATEIRAAEFLKSLGETVV